MGSSAGGGGGDGYGASLGGPLVTLLKCTYGEYD